MRIGMDFDNTIVNYNQVFHQVACEKELISVSFPRNKLEIRDYLRKHDKEDEWTEMQGYVYGKRMNDATPFPGVIDFIHNMLKEGHKIAIISHKTQYPYQGPQYDLQQAARDWIKCCLLDKKNSLLSDEQLFFENTKQNKIKRIKAWSCEYFIDDLPEVLQEKEFPQKTKGILFDPEDKHAKLPANVYGKYRSWCEMKQCMMLS